MIDEMIKELSKLGTVEVIKNDFVFTLFMTKDKKDLTSEQIPFKVLEIATSYLGSEKPNIEVMKNEENFLLLVLKPKRE